MMTPGYIRFQFENNTKGCFMDFTTAVCLVLDSDASADEKVRQMEDLRKAMNDGSYSYIRRMLGVDSDE